MHKSLLVFVLAFSLEFVSAAETETFPPLKGDAAPATLSAAWGDFDPRAEPLETEILHEWEEDGVQLQVVRFRIGIFKGKRARLAAIFGYPKGAKSLPGLVQIHGGGQYADAKACLMNAKRGYATVSIAWAGRISSSQYRLGPNEVKLFWEGKTDAKGYRETTDWGAVDGYHAPSRHPKTVFPAARPTPVTLDAIESPRNSPWFLCAVAARRAITFLESRDEVDNDRIGVYGHSMGGKLTVMTSIDPRVKAAAPSCGGISDRQNDSEIFQKTICDQHSLKLITCPIFFLSPANDFHGRIGDLPRAVAEIQTYEWRTTCTPHRNHQDTPEGEVATLLWFDQHLKKTFKVPKTPACFLTVNTTTDGVPTAHIEPDTSRKILGVDVYYSRQGKDVETRFDRLNTMARHWHHARAIESTETPGQWLAKVPLTSNGDTIDRPLWVYANVRYALDEPVSGAGYYYGIYTAESFNLSSLLIKLTPTQLIEAGAKETHEPQRMIESFEGDDWKEEWFSYRPEEWGITTHKIYDDRWQAPNGARLVLKVKSAQPNQLVIRIDESVAVVPLTGGDAWKDVTLSPGDFKNFNGEPLKTWKGIRELKLTDAERLRGGNGRNSESRIYGRRWKGAPPEFHQLRWETDPQDK